jgi:coenzyme F420-reducing hydrogenase beta subunit
MIEKIDNDCCGCFLCLEICPVKCIEITESLDGFLYPKVNNNACVKCKKCITSCPILNFKNSNNKICSYSAQSKNTEYRKLSSSGGVFSIFMDYTINNHGVVWGAAFDNELKLKHLRAENINDCNQFRGSKYVQSEMLGVYSKVLTDLSTRPLVLFSGTPCQVAGLYSFLGKKFENLVTCDLVCHGVPSPKVLKLYINYLQNTYKDKITNISFRDKSTGWKNFSISFDFLSRDKISSIHNKDPYMIGFLKNIFLRKSCYKCKFSKLPRIADISLGDYWGIENFDTNLDDDKGTSLIIVQNEKGQNFIDKCKDKMTLKKTNISNAVKYNSCINGSVLPSPQRNDFFNDLEKLSFDKLIKKYMKPESNLKKILRKIKNILTQ